MKRLNVFGVGALFIFSACLGGDHQGKVTVLNRSAEQISELKISIAGQTMAFDNLEPSGTRTATYKVKADDHFQISGAFKSGKKIQKEDGYVTNGMDFEHEIVVEESGVSVKQMAAK